jgi:cyclopropane-fatty-acyl-phospholipid synthase
MTLIRLLLNPQFEAGQAFMDGRLTIEEGSLYGLLDLIFQGVGLSTMTYPFSAVTERARWFMRYVRQFNPSWRSQKNVAHHYDLSDFLYGKFLDEDRQYSCAYFTNSDDSLEEAQFQKKRHIAAKLLLKPGHHVLDIGSGWGGFALHLAKNGADVTGLTLSKEQYSYSNHRVKEEGLQSKVRFKMRDYRHEHDCFDRIVSVGMFEHVGINHYGTFFKKLAGQLKDDGVALIHSIGRPDGPGHTNPWIEKYIFPGGYIPALSEVIPWIEKAGLLVTDIEILRMHYAETLGIWRERFNKNRDEIRACHDERFCRMWEFYLVTSELAFRHQGLMVFQIQLANRTEAVPITRDYITSFADQASPPLKSNGN